jgi:hypothetical protein
MLRSTFSIVNAAIGALFSPDTGAPVGAVVDAPPAVEPTSAKDAPPTPKAKRPRPESDKRTPRKDATPTDPMSYTEPNRKRPEGFAVWFNAFDGIEHLISVRDTMKERGEFDGRPGWTRAVWLDVEERAGRPVIIFRGDDLSKVGAGRTKSDASAERIFNDDTGAPRPVELAQYGKSGAKQAQGDCDALNTYFANRFGRASDRFGALSDNPRALSMLALIVGACGTPANRAQKFGRYGALSAKQAARESKTVDKAVTVVERLLATDNPKLREVLAKFNMVKK